jgi:hypothetical protein
MTLLDMRRQFGLVGVGEELYYQTVTDPNTTEDHKKEVRANKNYIIKDGWKVKDSAQMASKVHAASKVGQSAAVLASKVFMADIVSTKIDNDEDLTEEEARYMIDNDVCRLFGEWKGAYTETVCQQRLKYGPRSVRVAENKARREKRRIAEQKRQREYERDQQERRVLWERRQKEQAEEEQRKLEALKSAPKKRMSKKDKRRAMALKAAELASFMENH